MSVHRENDVLEATAEEPRENGRGKKRKKEKKSKNSPPPSVRGAGDAKEAGDALEVVLCLYLLRLCLIGLDSLLLRLQIKQPCCTPNTSASL